MVFRQIQVSSTSFVLPQLQLVGSLVESHASPNNTQITIVRQRAANKALGVRKLLRETKLLDISEYEVPVDRNASQHVVCQIPRKFPILLKCYQYILHIYIYIMINPCFCLCVIVA